MEDLLGFLHYPRKEAVKEYPKQRIRHWREYEQVMSDGQALRQAIRCMDCATPSCHCYCPVYNLIPEWNALVTDADWRLAFEQLDSTNNFPEFTGRICAAPCEAACTLSLDSAAVTIRSIELAVIERAWEENWVRPRRSTRRLFKQVAIIGSGPAGLACAQQLVRTGYQVTVYEKADRIGGLLRYGIPDFRLEKRVLDRRLAQLEAEGVVFRSGAHAGVNLDIDALRRAGHALVLACGSELPRDIGVPGRELRGIHFALDYLIQQNRRVAGGRVHSEDAIDACGKDVVVIGGGETGSDCVGTAIRQGARQVVQVQYHERPPPRADVLQYWPEPAPEWREGDHDREGCRHIWGFDTLAFEGHHGDVVGLVLQRLQWMPRSDGSWQKQALTGQDLHLPVQLVLLAMGYAHPVHDGLIGQLGLGLDERGNVAASDDDYRTSVPGVFACGDVRRGQSLVVWAIREGRQCARAVDTWLSGGSDLPRE
ncbi:MAG: glutamate synthase subunit beta [Gammaproteobacteria bacterium]|nr:glutamate synthase subunit beta [Gammaproteobacteria bacterium]MDH3560227.1 glutamate synthase subunit beta [Gammaproteobacteria bacterium]